MRTPTPPALEAARAQLERLITEKERRSVDLEKAPWPEVERACIKVLGGAFDVARPEHQLVAVGLAAAFAARLADSGAFWFPQREASEGAALGFADALVTVDPIGAVLDALRGARLEKLEELARELRGAIGRAKFGGAGALGLTPQDYVRLFDAGFVQLVAVDRDKAARAWAMAPERLASELKEAIGRAPRLSAELKVQLEQQLVGALRSLTPGVPLAQQGARAPRVCELIGLLYGAERSTGAAPEEFWSDVVVPVLLTGAPERFPPLGGEELEAARGGAPPFFLYLDVVPHAFSSPDEDGLLGLFARSGLGLLDETLGASGPVRLVRVDAAPLEAPLRAFDPAKVRAAVERFAALVATHTGPGAQAAPPAAAPGESEDAAHMLQAALTLLADLKDVAAAGKTLCVRRLTEAEAMSEPALALLRQALSGPRIILT